MDFKRERADKVKRFDVPQKRLSLQQHQLHYISFFQPLERV
jgi:hypothetical protein